MWSDIHWPIVGSVLTREADDNGNQIVASIIIIIIVSKQPGQ